MNTIFAMILAAAANVVDVPIGAMCNSDEYLTRTQPDNIVTVTKDEAEWVVLNMNNGERWTFVPAPEDIKPEREKGKLGWCLIKVEQGDNA